MEENIALLFLANLINGRETQKAGYSLAVRWLCLRADLKEKYISEAQSVVDAWWREEQWARASREKDEHQTIQHERRHNGAKTTTTE